MSRGKNTKMERELLEKCQDFIAEKFPDFVEAINYTGFTTLCKKCKQHVESRYTGKSASGLPHFELRCGCEPESKESDNE